jgi:hypothetical protein
MTAAVWGAAALAALVVLVVLVVLVRCLVGLVGRGVAALARRRRAELRAEALLLGWLSPSQRAQYLERGWFEVKTATGRYRIRPRGVVRLEPPGSAYCIEATSPVPVADEMLANKLLLETDERRFLATAHRYHHR